MSRIEEAKTYTGPELDTIFFRPLFTGPDAMSLGVNIMYNTPMPTAMHFWKRTGDVLHKYTQAGWKGGASAEKYTKKIDMHRVKAEMGYSADEYFSYVYEKITNRPDVNMDDLTGTELEQAETALFREAIAESIRATMWVGDTTRTSEYNTFDGFLKRIFVDIKAGESDMVRKTIAAMDDPADAEQTLKMLWESAPDVLRDFRNQGQLVFLVTSDIYRLYEEAQDNVLLDTAYQAKLNGRERLSFRGIPLIDVQLSSYLSVFTELPQTFAILTDRRNLALAVNTNHFPGMEVKMWYNPDLMENRQRAIFMAGCDYLLPELLTIASL